jgi:hypothetical protein
MKWFVEVRNCWFLELCKEIYIVLNGKRFGNGAKCEEDSFVVSLVDLVSLYLHLVDL